MVTFHASIHDCSISLFSDTFPGNLVVNPVRETPHGLIDLAKLHRGARVILDGGLEVIIEVAVIEEYIWIVEPAIEVTFDRFQ